MNNNKITHKISLLLNDGYFEDSITEIIPDFYTDRQIVSGHTSISSIKTTS